MSSAFAVAGVQPRPAPPDAYGNVEATEVVVGAEAGGQLVAFDVKEGQTLAADAVVGTIDADRAGAAARSADGAARRERLARQRGGAADRRARRRSATRRTAQRDAARAQARRARQRSSRSPGARYERTQRLFAQQAATAQQLDQAERTCASLEQQIKAQDEQIEAQEQPDRGAHASRSPRRARSSRPRGSRSTSAGRADRAGRRAHPQEPDHQSDRRHGARHLREGRRVRAAGSAALQDRGSRRGGCARLRHRAAAGAGEARGSRRRSRSTPAATAPHAARHGLLDRVRGRVHADADSDARRARRPRLRGQDSRAERGRRAQDRHAGRREFDRSGSATPARRSTTPVERRRGRRRSSSDSARPRRSTACRSPCAPGELFGFIGPDGAGKTTLFRILATLLVPDAGRRDGARRGRRDATVGAAPAHRLHAGPLLALSRPERRGEPAVLRVGVRHDDRARVRADRADLHAARAVQGSPRRRAVGRHEAEARALLRARASPGDPAPRRADDRRRRRLAPRVLGSARPTARRRADDRRLDAVHGRGDALRSRRADPARPPARRRHAGGDRARRSIARCSAFARSDRYRALLALRALSEHAHSVYPFGDVAALHRRARRTRRPDRVAGELDAFLAAQRHSRTRRSSRSRRPSKTASWRAWAAPTRPARRVPA